MKTIEMEIALMEWCGIRTNLVVPNVGWGMWLHECDILSLTSSGYATEIEIKVSIADLKKDKEKKHGHASNIIKYLYFAIPEKLYEKSIKHIPERAGILVVSRAFGYNNDPVGYLVTTKRNPIFNKNVRKWTDKERLKLGRLGTMRILGLKRTIHTLA